MEQPTLGLPFLPPMFRLPLAPQSKPFVKTEPELMKKAGVPSMFQNEIRSRWRPD
jgi:hypothetical protein